ncbi:hypothetical protein O0I10_002811 [Lichtheimia ornata]|uniref:C2 domain-containing protein n=1 Tax=Lichtheimia ornata TaxID=688661 RepID=A0AAD7V9P8_9FUNG|nr:uncharacterized protein O0I10_002811 [Lichtheimia ornata]KAJ8661544.1 hypothetical protein O0I10_002811 [Lichtheimia ornata]
MLSSTAAPTRGKLVVTVVEAQDLKKEDVVSDNDVYVEAWLNKNYKQKTGTMKNTSCPIWNETLVFPVEKGDKENKLYVRVLDKDVADSDKIGEGKLDFSNVYKEGTGAIDEWISLPTHFHLSDKGKVHLKVEFTPETEPAEAAPATQQQQ